MGLDGVEIIMRIEEAFDISIADEDAEMATTVNDVYQLVISKLNIKSNAKCKTSPVFYRIRNTLIQLYDINRADVKTESKLSSFIPLEERQKNWAQFQQALSLKIPELERPVWLQKTISYPAIGLVILGVAALFKDFGLYATFLFISSISYFLILSMLTKSKKVIIPSDIDTISNFVYDLLSENPDLVIDDNKTWTDKEVFKLVQAIIASQLCVPIEDVIGEASLVNDLGMG